MSPDPAADGPQREARRLALRLAFVAAFGFALGVAGGQPLPFLAPLFAVQSLVMSRSAPGLLRGLLFPALVAVASVIAMWIAGLLIDRPAVFVPVVGIVFFLCFLADARRRAGPLPLLLLIMTVLLPLFASQSVALGQGLEQIMFVASLEAVILVWFAHALFPAASDSIASPQVRPPPDPRPERTAFANMLVLLPLFVSFLLQGDEFSVVVLITAVTILRQPVTAGPRAALGLLLGNILGGFAALIVYQFATVFPSLPFLLLATLLTALSFAGRIVTAGAAAPVHVVGLTTFLILLGLGLSPTESGSGQAFMSRLVDVFLAVLYTIGAASLLRPDGGGLPSTVVSGGKSS